MLQQDDMSHYLRDKALEKRLAAQQARVNCTFALTIVRAGCGESITGLNDA